MVDSVEGKVNVDSEEDLVLDGGIGIGLLGLGFGLVEVEHVGDFGVFDLPFLVVVVAEGEVGWLGEDAGDIAVVLAGCYGERDYSVVVAELGELGTGVGVVGVEVLFVLVPGELVLVGDEERARALLEEGVDVLDVEVPLLAGVLAGERVPEDDDQALGGVA